MNTLYVAVVHGMERSVRFLLENGSDAVGGLPAIAQAICVLIRHGHTVILEILLKVEGEENQEVWANHYQVYQLHDDSYLRGVPTLANNWCSILHVAAKFCSIPGLHVLLSAGADTEHCDFQGKLAIDQIGSLLPDDKKNGSMEAAVLRMIQKGPAFRARSWTWPDTVGPTLGGTSKVPQLSSPPVSKKTLAGARTFRKLGGRLDISRSFDW